MFRKRTWRATSCGFDIGLENHLVLRLRSPRVHIDGDESFRFVNDEIPAAREPDLAVEGVIDLTLDAQFFKNRGR